MKILVTGSSGRVGRAIYQRMHREHVVIGLDQAPSSTTDIVADVGDLQKIRAALQDVDAVVHTAALHAPHVGSFSAQRFHEVNVQATEQLARAALAAGVRRLVFTSTTALYGAASERPDQAAWLDELSAPLPRTIYHRTKLDAENSLMALAENSDLAVTVLRMARCFPESAPIMAAYRLHRGIDVRDVAEAHAIAVTQTSFERGFRRYVISGDTPFLPQDCAALKHTASSVIAARCPGLAARFEQRGWALPVSIDRVYSPALAARELRWRAQHGFEDVLTQLDEGCSEVLPPEDGR